MNNLTKMKLLAGEEERVFTPSTLSLSPFLPVHLGGSLLDKFSLTSLLFLQLLTVSSPIWRKIQ
jgi:hypothetical protein